MKTIRQSRLSPVDRRGKHSAAFMLKALPAAMILVFSNAGWTVTPPPTINVGGAAGLPINGTVASGAATGSVADNTLTIQQTTGRAVIDWTSFNIDAGKSVVFDQQLGASSAVLNRVTVGTDASQIMGNLTANGTVMLMNPNGVMFGVGSTVNVGSLIATTGTINQSAFETSGHALITGAVGNITNLGTITSTAGASGLVALVAPSVVNQGVISATGGTIALAGSTAATLSLNGGLYEFAIPGGALGSEVANSVGASLNAKTIRLAAGDAASLLSGTINLEGVQQASSAIVVNGHTVELKSALQAPSVTGNANTVNVSGAARIQDGVNIAKSGGTVNVAAGTYVQPGTLKIEKSLTLSGAGEGATIIDARGVNGYGMTVTADDVTLNNFTFYGPTANVGSAYGIKVSPLSGTASARLHNFQISDVTIRGSGRAELDLNAVDGALINRVTADGAPVGNDSGTTAGAGIQITDSANVTITNSITRNNDWGGLALYQANRVYNQRVDHITVAANNSFSEWNPVYLQDESASLDFGSLNIAGFDFAVRNSSSTNNNHQYTWLQATQQNAFDLAVNTLSSGNSYVQGWDGSGTTQTFAVGTGQLAAGGTQAMGIGTAVNAAGTGATVNVYEGTYAEQLLLNKAGLTLTGHTGAKLVVPGTGEVNGITIAANNVTVTGMEIAGPATQSYLGYAWGNNISRGIFAGNGVTGFNINNNNIHDVRNGILIHGNNTGSVTGNRIDNTKSAISVQYTDGNGITMAGNTQGSMGNEWGLNLHLNGHMSGATIVSNTPPISAAPTLSWQQSLLALSGANDNWSVQDQAYTSSNRTHVNVATNGLSSAQGSPLNPVNTVQGGVNAVVTGGTVNVAAGIYAENVIINKALTLDGAGSTQTILKAPSSASGTAVTIANASNVTVSDLQIADSFYGLQMSGTSNNVTVDRVAFNNNSYGVRNGTTVHADNFRMLNSTVTGGLVGVQAYNGVGNAASFANALFENVTIDGPSFKGFYFETADNLTLRNVTVKNAGNLGDPNTGRNGSAIDINLKYGAFNAITLDNVVVQDSGHSAGDANRVAVVIKTRGVPGDPDYAADPASLETVNIIGGRIEGSAGAYADSRGSGLRIETLRNAHGEQTDVSITGSTQFSGNGQDIVADNTRVDARGAVFVGATNGFAIEDRVTHALDTAGRGLVAWDAGNVYVTQASGSVQRGVNAAGVGDTVNVANASFAENVAVNSRRNLSFNDTRLQSLTINSGAASSGIGGAVTAEGAGGFNFNTNVNLLADTTLTTRGANINLNGDIQNAGGVARALRLVAGSGNVHMTTGGSAGNALGYFDLSANNFKLDSTLWVSAYKINALGNVELSNSTLRAQGAGAASSVNAGGDVTGSTISQGSVAVASAGNIVANIAGTDVVAQAVGNMNVVVAATNTASLSANSVVANVTAPAVAVAAVSDATVSGSAGQVTMDAPRGSVTGSFGQVNNSGTGVININGKPQPNPSLSSNTENNRVVPTGVSDDGGNNGDGVQLAQADGFAKAQGADTLSLSSPETAGDALDNGQSVELDMSPRKSRSQASNSDKDEDKD